MNERSTRQTDRFWDDGRLTDAYRALAAPPSPAGLAGATLAAVTLEADRNGRSRHGFAWPAWRQPRMVLSLFSLAATVVLASGLLLTLANRGSQSATASQAVDTQGQFQLLFALPGTDWHSGDSITGNATLSYLGSGGVDIGSSGMGPIGFEFAEVGGSRQMGGLSTSDLVIRRLEAGVPITSPIKKSVAWNGDDPNGAFYRSWYQNPLLQLPAGDWTITATANFETGSTIAPDRHSLRASVLVHITG